MRKFFSMILMMVLCAGVAVAETATVGDCTWTYKEKNGVWKIESVETTTNEIVVPSTLGGKCISVISSNAFNHCYWSPEQAALRKYTTYGKVSLADEKWNEVAVDAAKYNFFKVTVEMR